MKKIFKFFYFLSLGFCFGIHGMSAEAIKNDDWEMLAQNHLETNAGHHHDAQSKENKNKDQLIFVFDTSTITSASGTYTAAVVFYPDQTIKSTQGIFGGLPVKITFNKPQDGEYIMFIIIDSLVRNLQPIREVDQVIRRIQTPAVTVFDTKTGISTRFAITVEGPRAVVARSPIDPVGNQGAAAYLLRRHQLPLLF